MSKQQNLVGKASDFEPAPICNYKMLSVGKHRVEVVSASKKIAADINFLLDRIERIKKSRTPNSTILKTYQDMLESRESVLSWLKQHH